MYPKRTTNGTNIVESISTVKRLKTTTKHDGKRHELTKFLDSMTFAHRDDDCECDECDLPKNSSLPAPAKKLALDYNSISNTKEAVNAKPQKRVFVARDNLTGISIWKWILPVQQMQPMLEFGNSHRIIYVDKLAKNTKVSIRICNNDSKIEYRTDWIESSAYFLGSGKVVAKNDNNSETIDPENAGLGWICQKSDAGNPGFIDLRENEEELKLDPCVLIMIKIPPKKLESNLEEMISMNSFYSKGALSSVDRRVLIDIFRQCTSDLLSKESTEASIDKGAISSALNNNPKNELIKLVRKFTQ